MVAVKAVVYRNAYQESEPALPDDKSAVCGEVGVTQVEDLFPRREMDGGTIVETGEVMKWIEQMGEEGKAWEGI